ncbi:hypothetical protein VTJ49DRAFT_3458 [Mycothermus thermophilus]|uniref:Methyltransferase domain-containing protein n=1 Tax=Humicola insolens TaxID=85995 RepID=A0ABR3VN60_HUMIN
MAEAYPPSTSSTASSSDHEESWLTKSGEDEDDEVEQVEVVSLFDKTRVFPSAAAMLADCKERFGFDFLGVLRRHTKEGTPLPSPITADHLADDGLLIPVLVDDALIFCLDELPESASTTGEANGSAPLHQKQGAGEKEKQVPSVDELLQKNAQLHDELERLTKQFANYRLAVEQTLEKRWGVDEEDEKAEGSGKQNGGQRQGGEPSKTTTTTTTGSGSGDAGKEGQHEASAYYFESYAHNDIHETMLKDRVRTEAYRDFIYTNRHLFSGKTVLDIGCGTGILSLFCAKAGASRVVAVDNSAILDRARENIIRNGLDDIITCVKGKIEEVTLPVEQFDIIVSEWMGYCLLYEAMLPSVLFARDKYLKPDGLLVPSHTSMWLAPVSDAEYVDDTVSWWRDVYGFDFRAMQSGICDETRMAVMPAQSVCGSAHAFRMLDLHTCTVKDLVFTDKWRSEVKNLPEGEEVDGFLVWFDCFFAESREEKVEEDLSAKEWVSKGKERVAFTTGPFGEATHWRQGLCLIDKTKHKAVDLGEGKTLEGEITYEIPEGHERGLNISITWGVEAGKKQRQTWLLH